VSLGSCRLGDSEAVLQHDEAGDFAPGNGQDDGKSRLDRLPHTLGSGRKLAEDYCPLSPARTSWTSKRSGSRRLRVSRMKSEMALRPVLRPIQGSTPVSPGMFQSRCGLHSMAISFGLAPAPKRVRSSWAMRLVSFSAFCTPLSIHTDDPRMAPYWDPSPLPLRPTFLIMKWPKGPCSRRTIPPPAAGAPARHCKRAAPAKHRAQRLQTLLSMNQPDGFDCPGCAIPHSAPSV
jgi:hypothetical protein